MSAIDEPDVDNGGDGEKADERVTNLFRHRRLLSHGFRDGEADDRRRSRREQTQSRPDAEGAVGEAEHRSEHRKDDERDGVEQQHRPGGVADVRLVAVDAPRDGQHRRDAVDARARRQQRAGSALDTRLVADDFDEDPADANDARGQTDDKRPVLVSYATESCAPNRTIPVSNQGISVIATTMVAPRFWTLLFVPMTSMSERGTGNLHEGTPLASPITPHAAPQV